MIGRSVNKQVVSGIHEQERKQHALTYEQLNKVASLSLAGLLKRMVDALNSQDPKQMTVFTMEQLDRIWRITRTERGLTTSISHEYGNATDSFSSEYYGKEGAIKRLHEMGHGALADAFVVMTPDLRAKFLEEQGIEVPKEPAILRKD